MLRQDCIHRFVLHTFEMFRRLLKIIIIIIIIIMDVMGINYKCLVPRSI